MTSLPRTTPQSHQENERLTERLRHNTDVQQGTTLLNPEKNEQQIAKDLNTALHDIIADTPHELVADTPLMLPDPMVAPEKVLQHHPVPQHAIPQDAVVPHEEEDGLTDWLLRTPEDGAEFKSRLHMATLCAGTMMISILAGYGSAQLLTRSLATSEEQPRPLTANASNLGLTLDRSSVDGDTEKTEPTMSPDRVRVVPVQAISELMNETQPGEASAPEANVRAPKNTLTADDFEEPTARAALAVLSTSQTGDAATLEPEAEPIETAELALSDETVAATAVPAPTVAPRDTSTVPDEGTTRMLASAEQLIGNGDIASARLVLRHLAETGHGAASMRLAQVYDADWLAAQGKVNIQANRDLALRWYSMAHDRGQAGAAARVTALQAVTSGD